MRTMYRSTSAPGPLLGQGRSPGNKQITGEVRWQPSGVRARDWPAPSNTSAGAQRSVQVQKQALHLGGTLSRAGEELSGMPKITSTEYVMPDMLELKVRDARDQEALSVATPSRPRLAAVSPDLWADHSKHAIVRDLYAGYSSDPLSHVFRGASAGSPTSMPDESPRQGHQSFFEDYVMRQAEIERLLEMSALQAARQQQQLKAGLSTTDARAEGKSIDAMFEDMEADSGPPAPAVECFMPWGPDDPSASLKVAAKTRSTVLDGDVLSCTTYNGGARFVPPDGLTWRFCIRPLDPPETHPIFVGVIPAGAELTEVAFFDRKDGVFLRVGGPPPQRDAVGNPQVEEQTTVKEPAEDLELDPDFYVFGERRETPFPPPRQSRALRGGWPALAVHFFQVYPREQLVYPRVQCKDCGELMATRQEFAEHCFRCLDAEDHSDAFGFDQYRYVEVVEEGEEIVLEDNNTTHLRFQVESEKGPKRQASAAEPDALADDGLPRLPQGGAAATRRGARRKPEGPWQPCVLLCTPGTRVQLQWLPAGPPPHTPAERIIRPAPPPEPEDAKKT